MKLVELKDKIKEYFYFFKDKKQAIDYFNKKLGGRTSSFFAGTKVYYDPPATKEKLQKVTVEINEEILKKIITNTKGICKSLKLPETNFDFVFEKTPNFKQSTHIKSAGVGAALATAFSLLTGGASLLFSGFGAAVGTILFGNKIETYANVVYDNSIKVGDIVVNYFCQEIDKLINRGFVNTFIEPEYAIYDEENICPNCGKKLKARKGPYGWYMRCSGHPNCSFTTKYRPVPKIDRDDIVEKDKESIKQSATNSVEKVNNNEIIMDEVVNDDYHSKEYYNSLLDYVDIIENNKINSPQKCDQNIRIGDLNKENEEQTKTSNYYIYNNFCKMIDDFGKEVDTLGKIELKDKYKQIEMAYKTCSFDQYKSLAEDKFYNVSKRYKDRLEYIKKEEQENIVNEKVIEPKPIIYKRVSRGEIEKRVLEFQKKYLNNVLFHEEYGKGIVINVENVSKMADYFYLDIKFDNYGIKKFSSDALNKKLWDYDKFKEKPDNEKSYYDIENEKEKKYFYDVVKFCEKKSEEVYEGDIPTLIFNYGEELKDFDYEEFVRNQKTNTLRSNWNRVSIKPYFAAVQIKNEGKKYIGKHEIDGYVYSWKSKEGKLYYDYEFLALNKEVGLEIVRDYEIGIKKYKGFIDKFNVLHSNDEITKGFNVTKTVDNHLKQLLLNSRENKKTHDIVETIQRNQYQIISDMSNNHILVEGCAGSGKTMVLFHKIAYLAFNDNKFVPSKICTISSNNLLNLEAIELSNELELNSIVNLDLSNFYLKELTKLHSYLESNFYLPKKCSFTVDEKFYSINYLNDAISKINMVKDDIKFIEFEERRLKNIFNKIMHKNLSHVDLDFIYQLLIDNKSDLFKEIIKTRKLIQSIPKKNLLIYIENNNKDLLLAKFILNNFESMLDAYTVRYDTNLEIIKKLDEQIKELYIKIEFEYEIVENYSDFKKTIYEPLYCYLENNKMEEIIQILIYIYSDDTWIKFVENQEEYNHIESIKKYFLHVKDKILAYTFEGELKNYQYKKLFQRDYFEKFMNLERYLFYKEDYDELLNIIELTPFNNLDKYARENNNCFDLKLLLNKFEGHFSKNSVLLNDIHLLDNLKNDIENDNLVNSIFMENVSYFRKLINLLDYSYFERCFICSSDLLKKNSFSNILQNKENELAKFILNHLYKELDGETKYTKKGKINIEDERFTKLKDNLNNYPYKNKTYSIINECIEDKTAYVDLLDFIYFRKQIISFYDYKNGNDDYLFEKLNYIDQSILKNINISKTFAILYILQKLTNYESISNYSHIFIDEYQNYSSVELDLLLTLFPSTIFNYYGDQYQKIDKKGIKNIDELKLVNLKKYYLNVNYRNANEICNYLNDEFDLNMISIGIKGKVEIIEKEKVSFDIENEDDRIALIVKDLKEAELMLSNLDANYLVNEANQIIRGKINVIEVNNVKGLEFEKVYVLNTNLNFSERYLSYSRALNELIIIK